MNATPSIRTWLPFLMAGVFAFCHGAPVRPRVLLVERLGMIRAPMFRRPCPGGR